MAERQVTVRVSVTDAFSGPLKAYEAQMKGAENQTRRVGQASAESAGGIDQLKNAAIGLASVGLAREIAGWGIEMVNVGYQSIATQATFTALSGGVLEATETLEMMRTATGNVVDDMTLMGNASRLLQMGLATTSEEAASLAEMAVKLGGSMGKDANSAMEEFALLLANQSIPRLDGFGISAGRVREQIDLLKEAGYSAEDAFRMAVLDQGEMALTRLGDAADVSSTSLARLETRWDNFWTNVSERMAQGVEGLALGAEYAPQIAAQANDEWWYSLLGVPLQLLGLAGEQQAAPPVPTGGRSGFGMPPMSDLMSLPSDAFIQQQNMLAMQGRADDFMRSMSLNASSVTGIFDSHHHTGLFGAEDTQNLDNFIHLAETALDELKQMNEQDIVSDEEVANAEQMLDVMKQNADAIERGAQAFERMNLSQMMGQGGTGYQNRFGELLDSVYEELEQGGMSDEQLEDLRRTFDLNAGRITDVSEFFHNELAPMLAQMIQDHGVEEGMAAAERVLQNLQDARMAGLSPRSTEMAMQVGTGYIGGGGPQYTVQPGDSIWGLSQQHGMSMDDIRRQLGVGDSNLIQPGMTFGGGGEGMSLDVLNDMAGAVQPSQDIATATTTISEQLESAAGPMDSIVGLLPEFESRFGQASIFTNAIHDSLAAMVAQVNVVRIEVRANAAPWLVAMFSGGQTSAQFVADVVSANGGHVPGAHDR